MSDNKSNNGVGFGSLLFLLFLGLKLGKVIDWAWIWVFAPIWIPLVVILVLLLIVFIASLLK